jgi:uncharacterized protein Yka (UPF0111/DUF47 family)
MQVMRPSAGADGLGLFAAAAQNAEQSALLLVALLADFPERAALVEDIGRLEHDGDRLTREVLDSSRARGAGAALEPTDVHALASALDDVVCHAEEAADQLGLYAVGPPVPAAQRLAGLLLECTVHVAAVVHALRTDSAAGPHVLPIHTLQSAADDLFREGLGRLFTSADPLTAIRGKDILGALVAAVAACGDAAVVLEGILLKAARRRPG